MAYDIENAGTIRDGEVWITDFKEAAKQAEIIKFKWEIQVQYEKGVCYEFMAAMVGQYRVKKMEEKSQNSIEDAYSNEILADILPLRLDP